ncbi:hypothetical protein FOCC_FOCC011817 [Frankliniella occidentalis]|nr:hypothetical protein FOCC_FOCC011817 [Frankliniella occidentalis]
MGEGGRGEANQPEAKRSGAKRGEPKPAFSCASAVPWRALCERADAVLAAVARRVSPRFAALEAGASPSVVDLEEPTCPPAASPTVPPAAAMEAANPKPMDISLLIEEVQKRPALWDQSNQHRHNREVLDVLWEEVARVFNALELHPTSTNHFIRPQTITILFLHASAADEIRKKWKGLRDTFRKELRKYPNGFDGDLPEDEFPQWVFFKPLYSFLKGQMKARKNDAMQPNGYHYVNVGGNWVPKDDGDEDTAEDLLDRADLEPIVACDTLRELGARGLKRAATDDLLADDEDYHFFLSLLPHVRKLEPVRKLQIRARIQDMICREVYGDPELQGGVGTVVSAASPSSVIVSQSDVVLCDVKPFVTQL